jgi:hypothetical protein
MVLADGTSGASRGKAFCLKSTTSRRKSRRARRLQKPASISSLLPSMSCAERPVREARNADGGAAITAHSSRWGGSLRTVSHGRSCCKMSGYRAAILDRDPGRARRFRGIAAGFHDNLPLSPLWTGTHLVDAGSSMYRCPPDNGLKIKSSAEPQLAFGEPALSLHAPAATRVIEG